MVRALIVIMVASFVLALGCFAGAAAIGGRQLAEEGWTWPEKWREYGIHISDGDEIGRDDETTSREIVWSGGDLLQIDLPADVEFTQGEVARVTISGQPDIVDRIILENGRLALKDDGPESTPRWRTPTISIVAPSVKRFVLNGDSDLRIDGYDQDSLSVEIAGRGEAVANGRATRVTLVISGSGQGDLSAVESREADVKVTGSGEARVSPSGAAKVVVAGSGDVHLTTRPASLERQVYGSGDIHVAE